MGCLCPVPASPLLLCPRCSSEQLGAGGSNGWGLSDHCVAVAVAAAAAPATATTMEVPWLLLASALLLPRE